MKIILIDCRGTFLRGVMEIKFIRYFLAVAEELHFSKAAKKLNMSQPPLSQQIMKLEQDLGAQLFIRDKRNVRLTEAGKRLVSHGRKILSLIEFAEQDVLETSQGKSGTVSIGYVGPAMDSFLPGILRDFHQRYPDVKVMMTQLSSNQQLEQIRNQKLHIGFLRLFAHNTSELKVDPVHRETYMLAVPANHAFAKKRKVLTHEISSAPLVFFPRHIQPSLYDAWLNIFEKGGRVPHITQEAESYQTIMALVSSGFGVGIVPQSTATIKRDGVVIVPIQGEKPELVISSCHLATCSNPVLNNFVNLIKERN